ncbi:hypothetical protein GEA64_03670 [Photorhabdus khanii]|uniref:Tail fiber protein n=1 Tax=Photorhabdus khanii TaxID=1004150 RepID=A0A7C9KNU7_9GAMM|nr:hypothetical protein [Photorhabdus khanii]MQL47143.1 hypothetical protein [Photorhabdus khanii]
MSTEKNSITEKDNNISASDLKNRFKEGSIPLQTDFADLIDIADIGRKAVGKAPGQTNNPNSALELKDNSELAVKIYANGGLQANQDGISVRIKDKSLISGADGLAVNRGKGLWINNDKLEVDDHHGIEIVNEGIKVKASDGINVDSNGVSIQLANNDRALTGLSLSSRGLKVDDGLGIVLTKGHGVSVGEGYGIKVNTNDVAVKSKNSTIKVESGGISVGIGWGVKVGGEGLDVKAKDNGGIKVDSNGVSVDINAIINSIIPRGTIVPFYSDEPVPHGWVLCDGKNGTPNLNDSQTSRNINIISGNTNKSYNNWNLSWGSGHLEIFVHFMRYIMKK